jgi:hypothetical protein
MFEKIIDNKNLITDSKEELIVDLTQSCFVDNINPNINYSLKRVPRNMIMRMDLVSLAEYDTDEYTEILLKYNDISNPFTLNFDDILIIPTIESMYSNIATKKVKNNDAKLVRNYHKYVDTNKLPTTVGSEVNDVKISKNYTEANMTKEDSNSIVMRNGRMYFGANSDVACSVDGIKSSDFNIEKMKNDLL